MADNSAWLNDLAKSGLTEADARELNIVPLTAAQTKATDPSFAEVPSLRINYMDPFRPGKFLTPRPKWPAFFRVRYLEDVKSKEGKIQRYSQPPASGVCAYFPSTAPWKEIAENPDHDIIITEGEKKAAAGCKAGFPTIGLGGVNSFTNSSINIPFLLELEKFNWVKRRVYVIFDSDITTKPSVCSAMNAQAKELEERGAIPLCVLLPPNGDSKVGLDDYLLTHSPDQLQHLIDSTRMSLTLAQPLWEMNEKSIYVKTPSMLVDIRSGNLLSVPDFKIGCGNMLAYDQTINPATGKLKYTKADLPSLWLKWPLRKTATKISFQPSKEMGLLHDDNGDLVYNSWTGWGVPSIKGDVKPFLKLVDAMFKLMKPHEKSWFMQWLAYPIQNPGAKIKSAVLVYSRHQGTGKSFLGDIISKIYGAHAGTVTNSELLSQFNRWAKDKQFVVANEVLGNESRAHADKMKNLVTETTITINDKNIPTYDIENCTQFYLTTNHSDGVYMTSEERRYFVIETGERESSAFYKEVDTWFQDPQKAGLSALRYYLENVVDCSLFDPQAKPPVTKAQLTVVDASTSTLEAWCNALAEDPDNVLFIGGRAITSDLVTAKELLLAYESSGNFTPTAYKTSPNSLGKHLGHAGLSKANGGANILVTGSIPPKSTYWIVRNADKWKNAKHPECAAHIKKHMSAPIAAQYR